MNLSAQPNDSRAEPPPLPGEKKAESPKRILPAFILCFVLSAHRIYAGKIFSGIVQIAWAAGAFIWLKNACGDLLTIVSAGPVTLETIERAGE